MRSSATEELLDDRAHFGLDDVRRLAGADQPDALGLGAENLEIALAHSPVKGQLLALEAVEPAALGAIALKPGARVEVEQQREVGHDAAGRARVELADQIGIDAAAVALVRDGGVGVPVAEHDAAAVEPRPDLLGDVLLARGHEEEDLDERLGMHARSLEQPAHRDSEPCSIGLAGVLDLAALPTKPSLEPHHLGRLARPFDTLERDQYTAHASENLRCHDSTAPGRPGIAVRSGSRRLYGGSGGLAGERAPRPPLRREPQQRAHRGEAGRSLQGLADLRRVDALALLAEADPVWRRAIVVDQLRRAGPMPGHPAVHGRDGLGVVRAVGRVRGDVLDAADVVA